MSSKDKSRHLPHQKFRINVSGSPNSCLVKIGKQRYRTLVDTGAECSLMHRRIYDQLKNKPRLTHKKVCLQSANGSELKCDGCITVQFCIGGTEMSQDFYVIRDLNRNLILGLDWLKQNNVRIYFDLKCLRINGKHYVNLEEDIHIASTVRMKRTCLIKPNTAMICYGKVRENPDLPVGSSYEVSQIDKGFLTDQPGLQIINTVSTLAKDRSLPVLIVNSTNKYIKIYRHGLLAKISEIQNNVTHIDSVIQNNSCENKLDLKDLDVPDKYRSRIENLILKNKDLFASKDSELGKTDTVKMQIDVGDHEPIKMKPYRTPIKSREVIDKAINEMLDANVIKRSRSPWSFPVVIVDKKDGSKRFCVDFRKLNQITKKNSFPLPLIDDILALLGRAKYFTSLDLKSGYWQVAMDEKDKEKTAFACHKGLFEFNVMPFGLSNAPAVFQELMSVVLQGCNDFATAYLDDILIFSSSLEEHLRHISLIFDRLRQHNLKLKLKKCGFLKLETNYLGFVISEQGIKPDEKKVDAIRSLPVPTCVKEVRSFIGMCSYYRRFIPNFSQIAEPIIALTRKYAHFKWSDVHQTAFEFLKDSLTAVPLLVYPDPNKPYVLYTDASNSCIGACLTQECDGDEKPIYYLSHKLSKSQCKWSVVEKEAFAIHFALQKLDYYLHNAQFVIKTDHKPLKYLLESPMQNKKIQLWALSMSGYNCTIEYIAGTTNTCADLLSRHPDNVNKTEESTVSEDVEVEKVLDVNDNLFQVNVLDSNQFDPKTFAGCSLPNEDTFEKCDCSDFTKSGFDMKIEQTRDDDISEIRSMILNGEESKDVQKHYLLVDGLVYYLSNANDDPNLRLFIPKHLRSLVVTQYHDNNGHMGVQKTFNSIRQKYFWPNLFKEIHKYVSDCMTCRTRSMQKTKHPLQETDIPPYPMAKLSLDLSGPYPTTLSGNKYIIAFVDWYSGWPEAFAVPDKTAETVAELIIGHIFPRFGCPLQIVTDNGTENVNKMVKETLERLNVDHILTSVYHPQSNAKVERFHRTLHDILAKMVADNQQSWDLYLCQSLAAIRFNVSESSKFSPYYLLYNRDVVLPVDNILQPRRKYLGEDFHEVALQEQHRAFVHVRNYLQQAKKRQAKYADKNTKEVELKVGDPVYYQNKQRKGKLGQKWKPYYRIIEKTGPVSFIIKNQLDGTTSRVYAGDLMKANVHDWNLSKNDKCRKLRDAAYVIPPQASESETESDSDPEEQIPLAK
ncbi:MAG: RNase H-like domain-containing protein, partial [Candidatus Thiodiazotropha endolucinida]|nr:DDE-type integrase/transposase/recombinase [Candidatus Thiodiazotropha taylori]MCW4264462.1 RNase H-like domain-containing protein [Candidatus Thiodiazotropha endolucinida]